MFTKEDINLFENIINQARVADPANARKWFEELTLVRFEAGLLEIGCPDQSQVDFLNENCISNFSALAQQNTGCLVTVKFTTNQGDKIKSYNQPSEWSFKLHPDYTFDNFVVGPGNRLCHASCVAISNSPGDTYNPLFIYGNVGLGKTHLLHAVCWEAKKRNPNTLIGLLNCEQFMNFFIQAIGKGNLSEFQAYLRSVDILIIDDIQFLRERERGQEEFFHTFNALYDNHKQIILTADCSPGEIKSLEERLVSRFKWGLVTSIDAPSYETRVAIVQKKAQLRGLDISEEIAAYVANRVQSNVRELEGALTSIYAVAQMTDEVVNLDLAMQALGDHPVVIEKQMHITDIIDSTSRFYNVKKNDLQSKKRSQSIALPRQICMYLARTLTSLSLEEIGGHLGGRDHTTVMHACHKIKELHQNDEQLGLQIKQLTEELRA